MTTEPPTLTSVCLQNAIERLNINPFKDEAQTALFKDPVRTAL